MLEKRIPNGLDGGTLNVRVSARDRVSLELDGEEIVFDKKAALGLHLFLQLSINHVPSLHESARKRRFVKPECNQ